MSWMRRSLRWARLWSIRGSCTWGSSTPPKTTKCIFRMRSDLSNTRVARSPCNRAVTPCAGIHLDPFLDHRETSPAVWCRVKGGSRRFTALFSDTSRVGLGALFSSAAAVCSLTGRLAYIRQSHFTNMVIHSPGSQLSQRFCHKVDLLSIFWLFLCMPWRLPALTDLICGLTFRVADHSDIRGSPGL